MKIWRLALFLLVLVVVLLGTATAVACLVEMDFSVTVNGRVEPCRSLQVRAPAAGVVKNVARTGSVAAGAVLLELSSSNLRTQLSLTRQAIGNLRAELAKEEGRLGNPQRRFSLRQQLVQQELQAQRLEHDIRLRCLRAPFAGRVTGVEVDTGAFVLPSDGVVLTLADDSAFTFLAYATPDQCRDLAPGGKARVRLLAYPYLKYGEIDARLLRMDDTPVTPGQDAAGRQPSTRLRLTFKPAPGLRLRPGMRGTADVIYFHGTLLQFLLRRSDY